MPHNFKLSFLITDLSRSRAFEATINPRTYKGEGGGGGTGGMNLRVRPRVNIGKNNYKIIFEHLSAIAPSRDKIKMFRYGKSA